MCLRRRGRRLPGSLLRLFPPTIGNDGISITWQSVTGRVYSVERSTNTQTFQILQRDLNGQAGTMTLVDPEPLPSSGVLYRVGAQ